MISLYNLIKKIKDSLKKYNYSPFVKDYLFTSNVRSSVYVSAIVALLEVWMIFLMILGVILIISGMLSSFEARRIYSGFAETNESSDRRASKKDGFFIRLAENFASPTFLALVIIFILFTVVIK